MKINTNSMSLYTRNHMEKVMKELQTNYERLSSARKINAAKDDASGISISENMSKMIRGNEQSIRNMEMVSSLSRVAEGALAQMANMLQRVREIAIQANNDTYSTLDKSFLQKEADWIIDEVEHIANNTYFNGLNLLNTGRVVYDPTTTIAGGGVEDGTKIVDIPAGGYVDVPFVIPPKKEQEGSILTFDIEKVDLVKDTFTRSFSVSAGSQYQQHTINIPDGYQIESLRITTNAWGDIDNYGEYVTINVDGTNIYSLGNYTGAGYSEARDIIPLIPSLENKESFTIGAWVPTSVSSAGATATIEVTYKLKGSILTAESPSGETFGPGQTYLDGQTGPQYDYANNSTVGAVYTGGGDRIPEQLKFYNPEEGIWYARVYNPSTSQSTRVKVEANYRIADYIPVHTGYGADDRELYTLSNVTRETIGLENLDVTTQLGILQIDSALEVISKERQKYGLLISKFETLADYRAKEILNVETSKSKLVDADMAKEASLSTKNKILYETSITMLVDVNQNPAGIVRVVQDLTR